MVLMIEKLRIEKKEMSFEWEGKKI